MRISVVVSVLLFAAACSLQSQRLSTESTAAVEQEILRAENRLAEALNALDDTALDALWADRLVFVGTNGHSSTKAQRLSGMDVPPSSTAPRTFGFAKTERGNSYRRTSARWRRPIE